MKRRTAISLVGGTLATASGCVGLPALPESASDAGVRDWSQPFVDSSNSSFVDVSVPGEPTVEQFDGGVEPTNEGLQEGVATSSDGVLYFTTEAGTTSIASDSAERLWTTEVLSGATYPPVVTETSVVGADSSSGVVSVAKDSGDDRWQYPGGATALTERSSTIYFCSEGEELVALRAGDGETNWSYGAPQLPEHQLFGGPAVDDEHVYTYSGLPKRDSGISEYTVHAVDVSTGELSWSQPLDFPSFTAPERRKIRSESMQYLHGPVVCSADVVLVAKAYSPPSYERNASVSLDDVPGYAQLFALDRRTGEPLWDVGLDHRTPGGVPAVDGESAYVTAGNSVYSVDLDDGSTAWERTVAPTPGPSRTPVATGDSIVVSIGTVLHCFETGSGDERWNLELGSPLSKPSYCSGEFIVASREQGVNRVS